MNYQEYYNFVYSEIERLERVFYPGCMVILGHAEVRPYYEKGSTVAECAAVLRNSPGRLKLR